jgi:putative transposase
VAFPDILSIDEHTRKRLVENAFKIEEYHRDLKQYCGVKACQARTEKSQRAQIHLAIRVFIRIE